MQNLHLLLALLVVFHILPTHSIPVRHRGYQHLHMIRHLHRRRHSTTVEPTEPLTTTTTGPTRLRKKPANVPMTSILLKQPILFVSPWWNINDYKVL
uniref:Secreted protein n=1 Tax=Steinernema glaseri TaxID=37863 RepID=A0A1I7Z3N3_9BILA